MMLAEPWIPNTAADKGSSSVSNTATASHVSPNNASQAGNMKDRNTEDKEIIPPPETFKQGTSKKQGITSQQEVTAKQETTANQSRRESKGTSTENSNSQTPTANSLDRREVESKSTPKVRNKRTFIKME